MNTTRNTQELNTNSRNWRTALVLALAALAFVVTGCGEGVANVDESDAANLSDVGQDTAEPNDDKTLDQLTTEEMALIQLQRDAIDQGLVLGKYAFADEINLVLEDAGMTNRYVPSVEDDLYSDPTGSSAVCPFLNETPAATVNTDCHALADRAVVSAYATLTRLKGDYPLDPRFDTNRDENEFWYDQGLMTGMDNEAILAVQAIRQMEACDQAPEPQESAFDEGFERGRQLYIEEVNKRFVEQNIDITYPAVERQIQVCRADQTLLIPARSRANERITADVTQNPLCSDFNPQTPEEVNQLNEAEDRFAEGMQRGIDAEHSLAEEKIFRVVPCNVGDPIVLDIAGDGIDVVPVTRSEVAFDLFGIDAPVRTAWIQGDDALLALDRNNNGRIDNGRELFGNFVGDTGFNEVQTGFDHLAIHDSNGDRIIDARDDVFGSLLLWQDRNGDGVSQSSELKSLQAHGIVAMKLEYKAATHDDKQVAYVASFVRKNLTIGQSYDVFFRYGRVGR